MSDDAANRSPSGLDPPRNGLGVVTLALGVSAVLTFWTVLGGILFGLTAAMTGAFGVRRIRRGRASNRAVTLLGLVAGVVGLVASVVFLFTGWSALSGFPA